MKQNKNEIKKNNLRSPELSKTSSTLMNKIKTKKKKNKNKNYNQ